MNVDKVLIYKDCLKWHEDCLDHPHRLRRLHAVIQKKDELHA